MKTPKFFGLLVAVTFGAVLSHASPLLAFRLVADAPSTNSESLTCVTKERNMVRKEIYNVQKEVLLDEASIKSAWVGKDYLGQPEIDITLTKSGAKKFAKITRENLNKQLAIVMDGKILSAPIIRSEIPNGSVVISGRFTAEQAQDMAKRLNEAAGKK